MIFGNWPIEETEGAMLAYAIMAGAHSFRKGTLLTRDHIAILGQQGITHVLRHALRHMTSAKMKPRSQSESC